MTSVVRARLLVVPALCLLACGAPSSTPDAGPPACEGDGWSHFEWIVDGERGRTPCLTAFAYGWVSGGATDGTEPLCHAIGPFATREVLPALPRPPLCLLGVHVYNIEIRTGDTGGEFAALRPHDARPAFIVQAGMVHGGSEACVESVGELQPATAGTWRVLQGGSWGDVVDIELEDITFDPFDGHTVEVPYARFRAALPVDPIRYP